MAQADGEGTTAKKVIEQAAGIFLALVQSVILICCPLRRLLLLRHVCRRRLCHASRVDSARVGDVFAEVGQQNQVAGKLMAMSEKTGMRQRSAAGAGEPPPQPRSATEKINGSLGLVLCACAAVHFGGTRRNARRCPRCR